MAKLSSLPAAVNRLRTLEARVADLQQRVEALEADAAAVDAVRADVAKLTVLVTEQLNQVSDALAQRP